MQLPRKVILLKAIMPLLLIGVGGGVWLIRSSSPQDQSAHRETPALTEGSRSHQPGARGPSPAPGAADMSLDEDIRAGTMAVALEGLKNALQSGSEAQVESAVQFLGRLLEEDPRNVQEVFAAFEAESEPALMAALGRLLAPHVSLEDTPESFNAALALVQASEATERRLAALSIFSATIDPPADLLETVLQLSREDQSAEMRLNAVFLLGGSAIPAGGIILARSW